MKTILRLLAIGMCGSLIASCGGSEEKQAAKAPSCHNVFVTTPHVTGGGDVFRYPATVEEARTLSVGFKTPGQIKRLLVKEGDHVRAGQLLAVLDTVDYALGVNQLRVQYEQMLSEFGRQKQLHAAGNMSDNDFEKVQAGLRQLALNLKMNQNKLDYCKLYAPASGVITSKNFEYNEMVDAGTPVFELMDNSHLEVVADIPVSTYMQRQNFKEFKGSSSLAPGETYRLSMLSLTPKADNNQLYQLKMVLSSPGSHLTPGQDLNIEIVTEGRNDGPEIAAVPLSAVLERDGKSGVWSVNPKDSTISFVPVALSGTGENGMVTVTSGITPGMTIVRAGVHHLTDGERVNILTEESPTNPGNVI
jgi:RND family efflux transporter MFP subunit